jgi:hypothetical protein
MVSTMAVQLQPYEDTADDAMYVQVPLGASERELVATLRSSFWQLRMTEIVATELRALHVLYESDVEFRDRLARLTSTEPARRALAAAFASFQAPWDREQLLAQ